MPLIIFMERREEKAAPSRKKNIFAGEKKQLRPQKKAFSLKKNKTYADEREKDLSELPAKRRLKRLNAFNL